MKLNLGCGRKLLEGYVNVDMTWDGDHPERPDVICDIRDLRPKFKDEVADEILALHCIEHVHSWEALPMLKDWHRVMKPGGKLIIECPDLFKCAVNFLQIVTTGHSMLSERLGILGMYGEQDGRPTMAHKWGYWPESLIALVTQAGFVNARSEVPQTHFKERDMRVVAEK